MAEPLRFEEIWERFVAPAVTLLSVSADRDSHVTTLQLRTGPDEQWLEVRHPMIEIDTPDSGDRVAVHGVLFPREVVTTDHVAQWLDQAPDLSPIPGIVAAIRTGSERTLANQLLDLATAAEGLHRRLPDQPKPMSRGQARSARHAARDAVDPALRDRVNDALGHLDDPTFAERLRAVTDLAVQSIPEAMGDRELWEQRIKQARNGFAHQDPNSATDEWQEYLVLLRTLRWVLITALLSRASVNPPPSLSDSSPMSPTAFSCVKPATGHPTSSRRLLLPTQPRTDVLTSCLYDAGPPSRRNRGIEGSIGGLGARACAGAESCYRDAATSL